MSKLMTPLFFKGNFNRQGKKVRAEFVREVSANGASYRLWRHDAQPERSYPHAENDKYFLHIEVNEHLVPLNQTEYSLNDTLGYAAACDELYGGSAEREKFFDAIRIRYNATDNFTEFSQAVAREREVIERIGSDPAKWVAYINEFLQYHIKCYQLSVENGGDTFPDFIGAVAMDDLSVCLKLLEVFGEKSSIREKEAAEKRKAEDAAFCEEQNAIAQQQISKTIYGLKHGGRVDNVSIEFYQSRYNSKTTSVFNYLLKKYDIATPLRTVGWINNTLQAMIVKDGTLRSIVFLRKRNGQHSQRAVDAMNALLAAINADMNIA